MKTLNNIFLAILIIGAINWGLIGLFNINLVGTLFGGSNSIISRIIFAIVGLSGLWGFTFFNKMEQEDEKQYNNQINS